MIIDRPHATDVPALRQLWKQAFGDTDGFLDGFFRTGFAFQRCRCLTVDDQLAAALYWFDCDYQGKNFAYLYAVATDETCRGKGLCRALLEDTHRHLYLMGYSGCVLVPGSKELFAMYEKMGYLAFYPIEQKTIPAGDTTINMQPVTPDTYMNLRSQRLPAGSILQEEPAFLFASTFCEFYAGEDVLLCCAKENDILYFQEYLGDPALLGSVVNTLGCQKAFVNLPGGDIPFAMYYPLEEIKAPVYFGIPLN